ncbi:DNA-directed DNA polymerase alpha subunit pol12 [Nowakowskiella sp. JEL0407]|nr:DNA-directed DNA polymerase alpha subunit pol12 [Nowakowskiella sp. JEL0407]
MLAQDESSLIAEIKSSFNNSRIPGNVLERLVYFCRSFSIEPDALFIKWETHAMSQKIDGTPTTLSQLEPLHDQLRKEALEKKSKGLKPFQTAKFPENGLPAGSTFDQYSLDNILSSPRSSRVRVRDMNSNNDAFGSPSKTIRTSTPQTPTKTDGTVFNSAVLMTPESKQSNGIPSNLSTATPSTPIPAFTQQFADRQNRANKDEVYNSHVPGILSSGAKEDTRAEISLLPKQQLKGYRYMFEKLSEKANVLNSRIDEIANILADHIKSTLSDEDQQEIEWENPGIPHQENIYVVGRICNESDDDVRMNPESIMLQCSPENGNGVRIKLDLEAYMRENDTFALFPGQIVAIQGMSPTGKCLFVSKIFYPPYPDPQTTSLQQLVEFYPSYGNANAKPLNIFVAAGPYTLEDSLKYEPFEDFVLNVEKEHPDVVILLGPFIDSRHPMIDSGKFPPEDQVNPSYLPEDLFKNQISTRVERIRKCRNGTTRCILIPSTRDIVSEWMTIPQPPIGTGMTEDATQFRKTQCGLYSQQFLSKQVELSNPVLLFSNPVQFLVNEVVFAASNCDVLRYLGNKEMAKQAQAVSMQSQQPVGSGVMDRMQRLYHYVLEQRSFYPLFPGVKEQGGGIDVERMGAIELQAAPDILICVSTLKSGVKVVNGCVCINPGSLAKGRSGGTFARLILHPLELTELIRQLKIDEEDVDVPHQVSARCRVEIERL